MKSIDKIIILSPDLLELKLNNTCKGISGVLYTSELLTRLNDEARAVYLMKLALNNTCLSDHGLIKNLVAILESKKHLQFLDLSWAGLSPRDLEQITK